MERLSVLRNHLSQSIIKLTHSSSVLITINRPNSMNALDFDIIYPMIAYLNECRASSTPFLITGIVKRAFGAGGDLNLVTKRYLENAEFMRSLHHMCYLAFLIPNSASIWTGHVIGSGAGLACSCATRIAMPSSIYTMPETGLGHFPNVGATYFLTHMTSRAIGLYIGLTGISVSGIDCYTLGLCNFFIADEDYDSLIEACKTLTPIQAAQKFHRVPNKDLGIIWMNKERIEKCFGECKSLEAIFDRLKDEGSEWANLTLSTLEKLNPLSLKVTFEAFKRGADMKFKDCLEMEYRLDLAMMVQYRYNFFFGVRKKLKKKLFEDWVPAKISEVTESMLAEIFNSKHSLRLTLDFLEPPIQL